MSDRRYLVKEMFGPTLQREGAHAGRVHVGPATTQGEHWHASFAVYLLASSQNVHSD